MGDSRTSLVVRPKAGLSSIGVLTFLITIIPMFGVLYWYTAPYNIWPALLTVQLILAVGSIGAYWRQAQVFTAVTHRTLEGNGIFSPISTVPLDDIARILMVPVYRSHPNETITQWIALSQNDRCLFRLRGQFWHPADLTALAEEVGKPVTVETTPLSEKDFFTDFPGSAYWFERSTRRRLIVPLSLIAVACAAALVIIRMAQAA